MLRRLARRVLPDRLVPFALLATGRPDAAAAQLSNLGSAVSGAGRDDRYEALEVRLQELERECDRLRTSLGEAIEYFDRNLGAIENEVRSPG